jgi:zinc and cadmium transporter
VAASSSFVYVSVADLIPQLQRRLPWKDTALQLLWLGVGIVFVLIVVGGKHSH